MKGFDMSRATLNKQPNWAAMLCGLRDARLTMQFELISARMG
jgi:hypothetical protein